MVYYNIKKIFYPDINILVCSDPHIGEIVCQFPFSAKILTSFKSDYLKSTKSVSQYQISNYVFITLL